MTVEGGGRPVLNKNANSQCYWLGRGSGVLFSQKMFPSPCCYFLLFLVYFSYFQPSVGDGTSAPVPHYYTTVDACISISRKRMILYPSRIWHDYFEGIPETILIHIKYSSQRYLENDRRLFELCRAWRYSIKGRPGEKEPLDDHSKTIYNLMCVSVIIDRTQCQHHKATKQTLTVFKYPFIPPSKDSSIFLQMFVVLQLECPLLYILTYGFCWVSS